MKWHDASPLPYLVIFIPLSFRFIYTSDRRYQMHQGFQNFASRQRTPPQTKKKKSNNDIACLLVCSVLCLIHKVIRKQNLNRKSIHLINCQLCVWSHFSQDFCVQNKPEKHYQKMKEMCRFSDAYGLILGAGHVHIASYLHKVSGYFAYISTACITSTHIHSLSTLGGIIFSVEQSFSAHKLNLVYILCTLSLFP